MAKKPIAYVEYVIVHEFIHILENKHNEKFLDLITKYLPKCRCTPPLIQRYLSRISGPLLDRIDLHIQVPAVKYKELAQDEKAEESSVLRERILAARMIQY